MVAKVLKPTKEEWQSKRPFQIGASEVATILGVSKYGSIVDLWKEKTTKHAEPKDNEAMLWGHLLEPAVAELFHIKTGYEVIESSKGDWQFVREGAEWMSCSPDRTYWITGTHNAKDWSCKGLLECKTSAVDPEKPENNWLLKCWYCQVQWQLLVAEMTEAHLCCMVLGYERKSIIKHWKANPEFQAKMLEIVTRFWTYNVGENIAPEPRTKADIEKLFPIHEDGKAVEASEDINGKYLELKLLKDSIKDMQVKADELTEQLILSLGDAEKLEFNGATLCTYKAPKSGFTFDTKAFQTENAELYGKYLKPTQGARRFILK